jgi:hemerythrin superfamily protein
MKKLVKRVEKLKDYVKEIDKAISKHNQSKINKYYKKIVSLYGEISPEQRGEVRRAINKLDLRIKNLAREENNNGKH